MQAIINKNEMQKKYKEGKIVKESEENRNINACVFTQRRVRGILARKQVERLREEEMEFLGMRRKKKTPEEERNDPIKIMEETRMERKLVQQNNYKRYLDAKIALKEEIDENEGTDLMEQMLKDRREWVNE